jgi:hypothetical protein
MTARKSQWAKAALASLASLFGSSRNQRSYRTRLLLELLEDRCVPATITPTTFADGVLGSGSLRDAVLQFNADADSGDDTINLLAGNYALTIVNTGGIHETAGLEGDLNITNTSHRLIVEGAGSSTVIDASQLQDRVFDIVNPGTVVVFQNVVITGGLAQDDGSDGALAGTTDALGGGILNNGGNITLDHVVLTNNVARGGDAAVLSAPGHNASGGGFYSTGGALTLAGVTLANNQVIGGRGGDHYYGSAPGGSGGSATGGGLYATGGSLDISGSMIASNQATGGRGGDGSWSDYSGGNGGGGGTGQGGGLYVNGSSVTLATSTIASNQGGGGSGGAYGNGGVGQGGGLYNGSTLTVMGSTLFGNAAVEGGGIDNFGTLTVSNSTLSGNSATYWGGGIYNTGGTLTVNNSTISGNSTLAGGGIYNSGGTCTVNNSTISGNSTYSGGGIYNWFGTLTVNNSTLSGNSATYWGGVDTGGGIYTYRTISVTLTNVTLTANRANSGGGLYVELGSPILHNTLIAGNFRGATGTTRDDVFGALNPSGDYNLIGDGTGMTGLSNGVNGNLVGIDPLLGPLQDNGGPTKTHALLAASPAIDAGNNTYATDWDQRGEGFPRIVNGIIDIGAFEYQGDGAAPLLTRSGRDNVPAVGALLSSLPPNQAQPIILSSVPTSNQDSNLIETDRVTPTADATLAPKASPVDMVFASFHEAEPGPVAAWWDDLESADGIGLIGS